MCLVFFLLGVLEFLGLLCVINFGTCTVITTSNMSLDLPLLRLTFPLCMGSTLWKHLTVLETVLFFICLVWLILFSMSSFLIFAFQFGKLLSICLQAHWFLSCVKSTYEPIKSILHLSYRVFLFPVFDSFLEFPSPLLALPICIPVLWLP